MKMLAYPFSYIDEWLLVLPCFVICVSCALYLNSLRRDGDWGVKLFLYLVGMSALGTLQGPFQRIFNHPTLFIIVFYWLAAGLSVKYTAAYWRELATVLPKRKPKQDELVEH